MDYINQLHPNNVQNNNYKKKINSNENPNYKKSLNNMSNGQNLDGKFFDNN